METPRRDRLVGWAVVALLAAGMVHGLNVQEHLNEWWGYGLFFLIAAAGQVVYGLVLLVRPWNYDDSGGRRNGEAVARPFYLAGIIVNCALIMLYLVTRTTGIPWFGPGAGKVEQVTALGVVTELAELAAVVCLVSLFRRSRVIITRDRAP